MNGMWLDVRCMADLEAGLPDGRCQLYVGHCGAHALLLATAGGWLLRSWTDADVAVDVPFGPAVAIQLPWAPTYPKPRPQTSTTVSRQRGTMATVK